MSTVERLLPSDEARDLIELTREICAKDLAPQVDAMERAASFPTEAFTTLGRAGLLSLPYPEEFGGGGQPYEVYLQVIEEIASVWMSVAVGTSVHSLSCFPVAQFGTRAQQETLLPAMLEAGQVGAFSLSESQAGSDIASMTTRARPIPSAAEATGGTDDPAAASGYSLRGTKAWISHAGHAGHYTTFARTGEPGPRGLSCFVVPGDAEGLEFAPVERKMGLHCDPVRQVTYNDVVVEASRRIGDEGQGMTIALAALDAGRLGIAAAATGLAQGALDHASVYAREREQFGRPIIRDQGLAFVLADMAAAVGSARASYLYAARLKDAGRPFSREAAIAKLVCTDNAMKVATDAIQVFGGAGYVEDFPVERYFRDAKIAQIFEGTNQIQRIVIARSLARQ